MLAILGGDMSVGTVARALAATALAALALAAPARAGDPSERSVLDEITKDLSLNMLAKPDDTLLKVPLAPERWSLFGVLQPYASLSPRVYTPAVDTLGGLGPAIRDPADDPLKAVRLGAGLSLHLSNKLEVFGEYQILNMGAGRGVQLEGSLGSPGLKGGFSIRY